MTHQTHIIFGGSGFIGSHLAKTLAASGHEVIIGDLVPPPAALSTIPNIIYYPCDVRQPISLPLQRSQIDTVYNLAAVHRTPGHPDVEYFDTNVFGALRITQFCRKHNVHKLLFTSSIAVYGPDEEAKYETTTPQPVSAYGHSKWEAEAIHRQWVDEQEGRLLRIVRPAVIFGEGENGNFTRLAQALKRHIFFYPGRKDTIKACGYVKELLSAIAFSFTLPQSYFLFNFAYPTIYTTESICQAFRQVAGLPLPLAKAPAELLMLAAVGFMVLNAIGLKNGINPARIHKLMTSTYIVPQALEQAGYRFQTDLVTALADWYRSNPNFR